MCSSYRKFEPLRSRNYREKKSDSDPGQFHYALITSAHYQYISDFSSIIPISIQLLIPDLIFPVYKIDCEQSEKNVSKECLKIPKRYSEVVVFENFLKD
jgi:hypothetical protein